MENNKLNGWLADIYIQMQAQIKKQKNKWALQYDQEKKEFVIDIANSVFDSTTGNCILDQRNNLIVVGIFDTKKECIEYYNNIVKIKNEIDHEEHGHVEDKHIGMYQLRIVDCSNSIKEEFPKKETSIKSIKQLRQTGYKVRVMHERDTIKVQTISGYRSFYNARGGSTTIQITTPEGITIEGKSRCSEKENFCRKTGNRIAIQRAFEKLNKQNN
jgi:hypothetical protein